ncbi:MAG: phage terminase large subunit family protein [Pseudomonadota bacterium]
MTDGLPLTASIAKFRRDLAAVVRATLRPPPVLTLSEWANTYGMLSAESSAEPGRFKSYPYQDGVMDAITDPEVRQVTWMKSARVGYTAVLKHIVGFFIDQDPSPILLVQPRVEDAEDFSKTEIDPMFRDTPRLKVHSRGEKGKDPKWTIRKKLCTNGASLRLLGAMSPNEFRRLTARVVLFDEVDSYVADDKEGDPIRLGAKRAETFGKRRKIVLGSTPTIKGESIVEAQFEQSDQRYYMVPCPHCGERQRLEWGGPGVPYGIKFDRDEHGTLIRESVHYVCRHHGCVIEEKDKPDMIAAGEWVATKPFTGHAGFHISSLYSLLENAAWPELVREFLDAKDRPDTLQTFINTTLGETWEIPPDQEVDAGSVAARRERYAAEVPSGVALLTLAVDVQPSWLEVQVDGWGFDEERWVILHEIFPGDPDQPQVWDNVDSLLNRVFTREDGRELIVQGAAIDTGGANTQAVYRYCTPRVGRRVWPIKGVGKNNGDRGPVWPRKPSRKTKGGHPVYSVDVNAGKDAVFPRFAISTPGPGYVHFPHDLDLDYFEQLTAEVPVTEEVNGRKVRNWKAKKGKRNEAFDLSVYGYAALCALAQEGMKLNKIAHANGATRPDERVVDYAARPAAASHVHTPVAPDRTPSPPTPKAPEKQTTRPAPMGRRRRRSRLMMG